MARIIIGSDHAGFLLKEAIKQYLADKGYAITDVGTDSTEPVDYPDFAAKVANRVSAGGFDRGILVCGSGAGMTIVANKFPHVRAALCLDVNRRTIRRWLKSGKLKGERIGHFTLILKDDVRKIAVQERMAQSQNYRATH